MLLARAILKNGDDMLLIGLSAANRRQLAEGHAITLATKQDTSVVPPTLRLVIYAREDDAALEQALGVVLEYQLLRDEKED